MKYFTLVHVLIFFGTVCLTFALFVQLEARFPGVCIDDNSRAKYNVVNMEPERVVLATAGELGIYHSIGSAIQKSSASRRASEDVSAIVEKDSKEHERRTKLAQATVGIMGLIREWWFEGDSEHGKPQDKPTVNIVARSSPGSVHNIRMVMAGEVGFGFAQSDVIAYATHKLKKCEHQKRNWTDWPQGDLRAVIALHPETLYLISRDADVETISDLRKQVDGQGLAVDVGLPGSGTRALALCMMTQANCSRGPGEDSCEGIAVDESSRGIKSYGFGRGGRESLVKGRTQALFYAVADKAKDIETLVQELHNELKGPPALQSSDRWRFVRVLMGDEGVIGYKKSSILAKDYEQYLATSSMTLDEEVETVGVRAILVTNAYTSERLVHAVLDEIVKSMPDVCAAVEEKARGLLRDITWGDLIDRERTVIELHESVRKHFVSAVQSHMKEENRSYNLEAPICAQTTL